MKIYIPEKTEKYQITMGVMPGYGDQKDPLMDQVQFLNIVRKIQYMIEEEYGLFISLNIWPSVVQYKPEWGCPILGEPIYTLECTRNPKFDKVEQLYKRCVMAIAEKLQETLKQCTVTITCSAVDVYYLTQKEGNE